MPKYTVEKDKYETTVTGISQNTHIIYVPTGFYRNFFVSTHQNPNRGFHSVGLYNKARGTYIVWLGFKTPQTENERVTWFFNNIVIPDDSYVLITYNAVFAGDIVQGSFYGIREGDL